LWRKNIPFRPFFTVFRGENPPHGLSKFVDFQQIFLFAVISIPFAVISIPFRRYNSFPPLLRPFYSHVSVQKFLFAVFAISDLAQNVVTICLCDEGT